MLLAFTFSEMPVEQVQAQTVVDRVMKRFFKKNRIKKYGKRLTGMGRLSPLEDMAINSNYEVIGFEPSWMIEKGVFEDHYFNLISTLVIG